MERRYNTCVAETRRRDVFRDRARRVWPLSLLLIAALIPLPTHEGASLLGLPNLCGFRLLTNLPCPLCGMTRSLVCACHLRFAESMRFHPLGLVVLAGWIVFATGRLRGRKGTVTARRVNVATSVFIVTLLVLWMARLAGWIAGPP